MARTRYRLCRPRQHTWQHVETLALGLPNRQGTYRVLQIRTCTTCHAAAEIGGHYDPQTGTLHQPHAGLWWPPKGKPWQALHADVGA